jgi:cytochrome P450
LSDSEVRDQILIFVFAGQVTTSLALTFALWLLGRHPDIQRRVRAEAAEVLTGAPTAEDARHLVYTTMVLEEATRLYPPVPFLGRKSSAEADLCGCRVPAGTDVAPSAWVIQRRPDLFENPEVFDPDRFAPERKKDMHKYAWFPFGHGPRLALARLVQELDFATPPGEVRMISGVT